MAKKTKIKDKTLVSMCETEINPVISLIDTKHKTHMFLSLSDVFNMPQLCRFNVKEDWDITVMNGSSNNLFYTIYTNNLTKTLLSKLKKELEK